MGLDAAVYCDCWEKGKLRKPAPNPELVSVDASGMLDYDSKEMDELIAFDNWVAAEACEHPSMQLVQLRLGNISHIAVLRDIVSQVSANPESQYPICWNRVIYNGIHGGDFLAVDEVRSLKLEIDALKEVDISSVKTPADKAGKKKQFTLFPDGIEPPAGQETYEWCWADFLGKMDALIEASLTVNKPLVF